MEELVHRVRMLIAGARHDFPNDGTLAEIEKMLAEAAEIIKELEG